MAAGASATLTGLVFVAVSIDLKHIVSVTGLPGRAAESMFQFLQVFFASMFALVPRQSATTLAVELLAVGGVSWAAQVAGQVRYALHRAGHPLSWLVSRVALSQLATLPFCIGGVELLVGSPNAMSWLLTGFIFSFAAGVMSAWVLLVEIHR